MRNIPSIIEFNNILSSLVKTKKNYLTPISIFQQMEFQGLRPDIVTINILINCYCHLGQIYFAFSLFGKILKMGYHPNIITLTTLLKALCLNGDIQKALHFHEKVGTRISVGPC